MGVETVLPRKTNSSQLHARQQLTPRSRADSQQVPLDTVLQSNSSTHGCQHGERRKTTHSCAWRKKEKTHTSSVKNSPSLNLRAHSLGAR